MRFCMSDGCGYVRKQQETQMVLTCCSSIRDAWLLSMVCQQTLKSSCLFALIPFLWKGLQQEEQTGNFSRSRPEEMSLLSLSPGSANLKLQRLTAAPSQSGSYTKKLPVLTDMHASYIPPLREHPVEADTPSRRQMDLLNDVEGRVPCSRCMLLSGRDKDGTAVIFWPQTEARSSTQLGGYQSPCATLVHPP